MSWFKKAKRKIIARRNMMESISKQLDVNFKAKEDFSSVPLLRDFYLFRTNHKKGISNIISGTDEFEEENFKIFDYKYVIQAGNTPVVFQQTVFFIETKNINLPKFHFYPRSKSSRWFYKIGFRPKREFTENEVFNKSYATRKTDIDDERFKDILNSTFINIINQKEGIHFEGNNFHLIIYFHNKLLQQNEIKKLHQTGLQLIQNIKEYQS